MLIKEFPDLHWLKTQINSRFENRIGANQSLLTEPGWPSVVLNVKASDIERKDIRGPYSLFLNDLEKSIVRLNGREFKIDEHFYVTSSFDQHYDLEIPSGVVTRIFNIHFGERLYRETLTSLVTDPTGSLDDPYHLVADRPTRNLKMPRSHQFDQLIQELKRFYRKDSQLRINEEELLLSILIYSLKSTSDRFKGLTAISAQRKSTREELCHRIQLAVDFIHDNYERPLDLDEISRICCLSKFHLLRTFKEMMGVTPSRYWSDLRLQASRRWLAQTKQPIHSIAFKVGYEEPNSFTRSFTRHFGISPIHFRAISNFG